MKYIKLFEAFSKDYMKKIDLKDFKKIKKGAKLMYMGGKVEVLDNDGYVLKLKGEDDRIFMVNKSQFDHGGMTMRESVNELRSDMISGTSGRKIESLEDRKYELKKDAKGATIGNFSNVTLPKGTIIYNLPGGVFADHFSLKQKYSSKSSQGPQYFDKPTFKGIMIKKTPALLSYIEKNSKVLESFDTEVTEGKSYAVYKDPNTGKGYDLQYVYSKKRWELDIMKKGASIYSSAITTIKRDTLAEIQEWLDGYNIDSSWTKGLSESVVIESSAKDGGDKSNGNSHHDDHKSNSIAQHWKDTYGEEFHSKYPAVAKIVKQRNIKDKRELKRIWDETYGENFEEQYPALYNKLD